jgi:hypothetical protein
MAMKRSWIALCVLALTAPTAAMELPDAMAQPSVFVNLQFGAADGDTRRLAYGLRFDSGWRELDEPLPPIVALDFSEAGMAGLRLGGVPLNATTLRLSQNESGAGPGLRFWNWGLPQWGMVAGAGVIAFAAASYEDPAESDAAPAAEESTACGDDVPQPVFGPDDCV